MLLLHSPQSSRLIGFLVHMAISATIGGVYGLVARRLPQTMGEAALAGAVNGVVWWDIPIPLPLGYISAVAGGDATARFVNLDVFLIRAGVFLTLA